MREKLREILQELHLQGMSDALDKELDRAEKEAIPISVIPSFYKHVSDRSQQIKPESRMLRQQVIHAESSIDASDQKELWTFGSV